jgi:hypothetical protein
MAPSTVAARTWPAEGNEQTISAARAANMDGAGWDPGNDRGDTYNGGIQATCSRAGCYRGADTPCVARTRGEDNLVMETRVSAGVGERAREGLEVLNVIVDVGDEPVREVVREAVLHDYTECGKILTVLGKRVRGYEPP